MLLLTEEAYTASANHILEQKAVKYNWIRQRAQARARQRLLAHFDVHKIGETNGIHATSSNKYCANEANIFAAIQRSNLATIHGGRNKTLDDLAKRLANPNARAVRVASKRGDIQ